MAVVAVVAAPADVSQWVSARGAVVGVPVCADTRTPHTACACVPMYGVRDAHGDGARRAELGAGDDSRDTARGAYARLAVLGGFALRIAHAACTPGYGCVSFRSHSL